MDDFTGAEIHQMWCERMRQDWQHTSAIMSMIHNANASKKSQQKKPDQFNPMEVNRNRTGIPLNSRDGFAALESVAKQWQRER